MTAETRERFPITERFVYMNHAAIAPLPRPAAERMAALANTVAETGDRHWPERNEEAERVRGLAARLLGARETHEVAFVQNTSDGLSLVAEGLAWQDGDNVVGAVPEFPSNAYPWMRLADRGVEYRRVPERDGRIDPDELLARIDARTRAVALSWVQYASGFRSDLARIGTFCRRQGVLFAVDAIQGLGALRLDVEAESVDVCVAATHKWLLGPEGLGLLYVSDRVIEALRPTRSGWRSAATPLEWEELSLEPAPGALRFESGTLNVYGIAALGASLEILLEVGPDEVERRVRALADRLAAGLAAAGFSVVGGGRSPAERSGIVAAVHPRLPAEKLVEELLEHGIVASHRAGRLRFSPHFYNRTEEAEQVLEILRTTTSLSPLP